MSGEEAPMSHEPNAGARRFVAYAMAIWRICMAIGFLLLVGNLPLIWVAFERVHVLPLIMPAFGLFILLVLVIGRRSFTVE